MALEIQIAIIWVEREQHRAKACSLFLSSPRVTHWTVDQVALAGTALDYGTLQAEGEN